MAKSKSSLPTVNSAHSASDVYKSACELGHKADRCLDSGMYDEAHKLYTEVMHRLEDNQLFDSYLIAKLTLGLLVSHIKKGEFKRAFSIWNANLEDSLFGIGIYSLENAQTSVADMIAYDFVCGFLHSLADDEPNRVGETISVYMSRVCEHAIDESDMHLLGLALSNWKQHLRNVFPSGRIPQKSAEEIMSFERNLPSAAKIQPIFFPSLDAWERPAAFREMTQVVELKQKNFKLGSFDGSSAVHKLKKG